MSRAPSTSNDPGLTGLSSLSGFNRQPLTPEQQMQALKRVQAQAEQRVKLGMQLFKAAEARLSSQTDVLQQIKTLQKQLREQVNQDVAQSLHSYDQWIGQIDESFTTAIRKLEEKIDAVQANLIGSEARMQQMLDRAETMLDQSRCLIEQNSLKTPIPIHPPLMPPTPAATPLPPITPASSAKPTPPITPASSAKPLPPFAPAPPHQNAEAEINTEPPEVDNGEDKIYSKLLQRLIEDNPGAESHGAEPYGAESHGEENDTPPDDTKDQADAA